MARTRQEDIAVLERRRNVAKRYLAGESQTEIARSFEVTQQQISKDLTWLHDLWVKECLDATDKRKARELAKLDELERQYWTAWQRSQLPKKSTSQRKRSSGDDETAEVSLVEEQRDGNPAYLQGVERCIQKRCELLGWLAKDGGGVIVVVQSAPGVDNEVLIGLKPGLPNDVHDVIPAFAVPEPIKPATAEAPAVQPEGNGNDADAAPRPGGGDQRAGRDGQE